MDKKVILLADDDLDDTEMFCEALEEGISQNIICKCADNGMEALKVLNELDTKPELIFLDLNMPVMNGWIV